MRAGPRAASAWEQERLDDERGSTLVLSIVLAVVALALVLTFAAITHLQIERKRLLSLADATAAHAASALDEEAYFTRPGPDVLLSTATVQAAATEYLAKLPPAHHARFEGLHVGSPTQALDSTTAQVTLASQVQPQFLPWGVAPLTLSIEVTSAARAD